MPLVNAKCTNCGAPLKVDNTKDAAICEHCGSAFIVEKAINNYHVTNKNSFNANVINVYTNSNWDKRETPIGQQIGDFFSLLEQTGNHRLLSPQQLINILNLATLDSSNRSQELLIKLKNYCNDLDFKFDFSYSKNLHCSLTYKAFGCDFQSLWHDSGKDGNDGSNFEEWILYDTNLLSGKTNILQLL